MSDVERMHILQMIEDGAITAEDGLRLLNALTGQKPELTAASVSEASAPGAETSETGGPSAAPKTASAPPIVHTTPPAPNMEKWKRWWLIPLWIGVGLTLMGALLMYWAYANTGLSFWLMCLSGPFALGVLVIAFAAASRTAKWIHVRVQRTRAEDGPRNIAISFPLPIKPTAWFLRTFGHNIPNLKDTGVDELITALGEGATPDNPLYVEVNGTDDGENVQVYIG